MSKIQLGMDMESLESSIYCLMAAIDALEEVKILLAGNSTSELYYRVASAREMVRDGLGPIKAQVSDFHKQYAPVPQKV